MYKIFSMFRIRTVLIQIRASTGLRIRIPLFSSVAFKMPTKNKFFQNFLLITYCRHITSLQNTKLWKSMMHVDGRIRTNKYGSGRAKNLRILRIQIQNTVFIKFANDSTSELLSSSLFTLITNQNNYYHRATSPL